MLAFYFLSLILALLCTVELLIITYKRLKYTPVTAKCTSVKRTLTGSTLTYRYEENSIPYVRTENICSFISNKNKDKDVRLYINPKNNKSFISEKHFKRLFVVNFITALLSTIVALSPFIGVN